MSKPDLPTILRLKAEAAGHLYLEGRISRAECFKHEVAVSTQKDAGPIVLGGFDPQSDERFKSQPP